MKMLQCLTIFGLSAVLFAPRAAADELADLHAQRIETLQQAVGLIDAQFRAGEAAIEQLLDAHAALLDAKLDVASTPAQRIEVLTQQLKLEATAERVADTRFRSGDGNQSDFLLAKAARLRVETLLLKEKKRNVVESSSLQRDDAADEQKGDVLATYPSSPAFDANADWQRQVGEDEIRMSYFSRGDTKVAMRCVANLSTYRVTTFREVHSHAEQSTETRTLSHSQVLTLHAVTKRLSAPDTKPTPENLLIVSYVRGKELRVLAFDAAKPPPDVIRLYDLTGAYLPAAADDDQGEEAKRLPANTERDDAASSKLAIQFLVAAGMLDEKTEFAFARTASPLHTGFARIDIHEPWQFLPTVDGGRVRVPGDRKRAYHVTWNTTTAELAIDLIPPSVGYGKHEFYDMRMPERPSSAAKKFWCKQDPRTGEVTVEPAAAVEGRIAPN